MGKTKKTTKTYIPIEVDGHIFRVNTIPRKDNRYQVSVSMNPKGKGKPYKTAYGKNELELRQNILRLINERGSRGKFETDVKYYLLEKVLPHKSSTYDSAEWIFERYFFPAFKKHNTISITADDVNKLLNGYKNSGYSMSSLKKMYDYLNSFFKYAVEKHIIISNPMDSIKRPTKKNTSSEKRKFAETDYNEKRKERDRLKIEIKKQKEEFNKKGHSEEEKKEIKNKIETLTKKLGEIQEEIKSGPRFRSQSRKYIQEEDLKCILFVLHNGYSPIVKSRTGKEYAMSKYSVNQPEVFEFMLQTGLRAGEMCGLKYSDYNPDKSEIMIETARVNTYDRDKQGKRIKKSAKDSTTKTDTDKVPNNLILNKNAEALLKKMMRDEPEEYLALGREANRGDYIVHSKHTDSEFGKPITTEGLAGRWTRVQKAALISEPLYGLHSIRHTFASYLYHSTHDFKLIARQLRHTDVQLTLNIYADLLPSGTKNYTEIDIYGTDSKESK